MAVEGEPGPGLGGLADLVTPMAIRVVATLRIADHIAQGTRTAAELARAVGVDADALDRVLRHLSTVDVLGRDGPGCYTLTPRGECLREDHPGGARAVLDVNGAVGRADLAFVRLLDSVTTGGAAFPAQFGLPFWDDLRADPARTASYDAQMGTDVSADAPAIVAAYDWGSLGHVIDVGGGNGTLLAALLTAHPGLRGTVVDQPATAAAARETFAAAGLADRAAAVPGSFFDPLPPGAGGYVLCAVLHDWNDEAASAILRRCAEAAGAGGTVFVVEKTGGDGESPRTGMDLRMLAYFGGKERGVAEQTALAGRCGLRVAAVHRADDSTVLELTAG